MCFEDLRLRVHLRIDAVFRFILGATMRTLSLGKGNRQQCQFGAPYMTMQFLAKADAKHAIDNCVHSQTLVRSRR